jgi:DNA-binding NarL/FixJ family response regulator
LPDIVVMDVTIVGLNGIEATRRLTLELPSIRVLGLSVNTDSRCADAMFAAGAAGYLSKCAGLDELVLALNRVAAGAKYRSPPLGPPGIPLAEQRVDLGTEPHGGKPLSAREREVLH